MNQFINVTLAYADDETAKPHYVNVAHIVRYGRNSEFDTEIWLTNSILYVKESVAEIESAIRR